jgi:hypothetical protein
VNILSAGDLANFAGDGQGHGMGKGKINPYGSSQGSPFRIYSIDSRPQAAWYGTVASAQHG